MAPQATSRTNLFSICNKFLVVIWFLLFIYLFFFKGKHDGAVVHCIICLRFSSPCGAIWERRNKECDFLATENVSSSPILVPQWWPFESCRTKGSNFGQGKVWTLCQFQCMWLRWRHFGLSLSHLTHSIPSASTLGIIPDKGWHTRLGSVKCIYETNCIAENFRQECRFRQCYF